ncbi:MAG: TonB family protein [Proteobacteria bacterium]|nr:TonB family protein [Pseudomonadota bacterium]
MLAALLVLLMGVADVPPPVTAPPPEASTTIGTSHNCEYPAAAVRAGIEGTTFLQFTITVQGRVKDVSVVGSSGNQELDDAAVECAYTWKYRSTVENGAPVEVSWQTNVRWTLSSSPSEAAAPKIGCTDHCSSGRDTVVRPPSTDTSFLQIHAGWVGNLKVATWELDCKSSAMILSEPEKPADSPSPPAPTTVISTPSAAPAISADQKPVTSLTTAGAKPDTPTPLSAIAAQPPARTAVRPVTMGRCHVMMIFHSKQNPEQAVMAVSFRLLGLSRSIAMIIRMPPLAKKGDTVLLELGDQGVKLPVVGCTDKDGCTALSGFSVDQETLLVAASQATLEFPPGHDGMQPTVRLPMDGLAEAIAAMHRADPKLWERIQ